MKASPEYGKNYGYSEELIYAVLYFIKYKKITRSGEIAKRLGLSPFTVATVKHILKYRGLIPGDQKKGRNSRKDNKKEQKDIIGELLGV